MAYNADLVRRAQMLLTLDHSVSQVKEILLREGYPQREVTTLLETTKLLEEAESALSDLKVPQWDGNQIVIDIRHDDQNTDAKTPDLVIDRFTGRARLLTPHLHETWRVAKEIRKSIRQSGFRP